MSITFISPNPFGGITAAHKRGGGELVFACDSANRTLIEEPRGGDDKNRYFREEPRTLIEYVQNSLLTRKPELATPGAVWSMLSNPEILLKAVEIDVEEGNEHLAALARHVENMRLNEEHWPQHLGEATRSLRIFGAGSPLHNAGVDQ